MEPHSIFDQMEFVKSFYNSGDRLNASGESDAPVKARTRIGWKKFSKREELLHGRKLSLIIKGKVYQSCVQLAMLYESFTWCIKKNEMRILIKLKKQ